MGLPSLTSGHSSAISEESYQERQTMLQNANPPEKGNLECTG